VRQCATARRERTRRRSAAGADGRAMVALRAWEGNAVTAARCRAGVRASAFVGKLRDPQCTRW
jgi:hypothetical protein